MFKTLKILFDGANARADERVRNVYSIELIDQKIREATAGLKAAKMTLASITQRARAEERQVATLDGRIRDLEFRTRAALDDGQDALAAEAANAIAMLENERDMRRATAERLEARMVRLKSTVEAVNRRIMDLRQGAIGARAARQEAGVQRNLATTLAGTGALDEAEALIASVLGEDDPFEQADILRDIEDDLGAGTMPDRLADAGYGSPTKSTGAAVLKRLRGAK